MKQSSLKNMMYDFFHILQLFTQAMKYLNETGRGHMECPGTFDKKWIVFAAWFCHLHCFSQYLAISFSLKVNGGI